MINTSQVSLRQARTDVGLGANGGLKNVQEFIDRHGSSGYSLRDLGGHVLCMSSKAVSGGYSSNYNRGASCRPNYAEANIYSVNNNHSMTLSNASGKHTAEGNNWQDNRDVLGGYSYVGTIPSGTRNYTRAYAFRMPLTATRGSIEIIGWSDGYFVGTPNYYTSFQTTQDQNTGPLDISMDGTSYPYVTMCIQALGTRSTSKVDISRAYIKAA